MIRLAALDLDGTLLNGEWQISSKNVETIRKTVANGVKVTLATGRMAVSARKYAQQLGLDLPIITYHGALVEQALSTEVLYRKVVPVELAAELLEILQKKGVHAQFFLRDRVFVRKANAYSEYYSRMSGLNVEEADIYKLLQKEPEGCEKILCIAEENEMPKIMAELKEIYAGRLYFTSSGPNFFDMLNPEVNKGAALKALAQRWEITAEQVLACGDSLNDIEMLTFAGIGVAMENAHPKLKEIADYITASNEQDGVAQALTKFVLAEYLNKEEK